MSSTHVTQVQNRYFATLSVTGNPRDRTQLEGPIAKHIISEGLGFGGAVFSKGPFGQGSESIEGLLDSNAGI